MSELDPGIRRFEEMSITERMRHYFQPKGTAPVVQLHLNHYGMFHHDFIMKCVDELERIPHRAAVGDAPTNLEKLAYMLLCDSAYIDTEETK